MATTAAARRYAQAVFDIAVERGELDKWRRELAAIAAAFADAGVHGVLESPRVPFAKKQELLNKALPGLSQLGLNLAYLLTKAGRIGIARDLGTSYGVLVDEHLGVVLAQVISAMPLDDAAKWQVSEWIGQLSGKKVVLEAKADAEILGGLVVRMGDKVIDASVRTRLERLKRNLLKAGSGV
ncbi:MAG: ATP synthase F1 subunit delta [Dehalococcoidia bacterium]|nr:ATP synthase F1 subunit delta [Dehalococcoidia bacterium]